MQFFKIFQQECCCTDSHHTKPTIPEVFHLWYVNPSSAPLLQKIKVTTAVLKQWTFQELSVTLSALKTSKTKQTGTCIFHALCHEKVVYTI